MKVERPEWMRRAACFSQGWDTFFDYLNEPVAKAICSGCEVKAECFLHAVKTNSCGIWGGTNHWERSGSTCGGCLPRMTA